MTKLVTAKDFLIAAKAKKYSEVINALETNKYEQDTLNEALHEICCNNWNYEALPAERTDTLRALLRAGATPSPDNFLHIIADSDIAEIKLFIEYGADVNAQSTFLTSKEEPTTPLISAIRQENEEIFNVLVENGADIHMNNDYHFKQAAKLILPKSMDMLLTREKEMDEQNGILGKIGRIFSGKARATEKRNNEAMKIAVNNNGTIYRGLFSLGRENADPAKMVAVLHKHGIKLDDHDLRLALHDAVRSRQAGIVETLGPDAVHIKDNFYLNITRGNYSPAVTQALLKSGLSPDSEDHFGEKHSGRSLIIDAYENGDKETATILAERGYFSSRMMTDSLYKQDWGVIDLFLKNNMTETKLASFMITNKNFDKGETSYDKLLERMKTLQTQPSAPSPHQQLAA